MSYTACPKTEKYLTHLLLNQNKLKREKMKKSLVFFGLVFLVISALQAQYYCIPYIGTGANPGGVNQSGDYNDGGWIAIHLGSAATPEWSSIASLPFPFQFNGNSVTQFKVSTSGVLTFNIDAVTAPAYAAVALPNVDIPDNSICILGIKGIWSYSKIRVRTFGTAPNRQHWIFFDSYASPLESFTSWSIVLEETSNKIYLVDQYHYWPYAVSLGVQINSGSATMVPGSPEVMVLAGDDPEPVDNTYYEFNFGTQDAKQAQLLSVSTDPYVLVPNTTTITGSIKNLGSDTINAIRMKYTISDSTYDYFIEHLGLSSGQTTSFSHPIPAGITDARRYPIKVWIEQAGDADHSDDTLRTSTSGLGYQPTKRVLIEGTSGTRCGWCPRSAVYCERIDSIYHNSAIPVEIHHLDPMANEYFDNIVLYSGANPNGTVDRKDKKLDPTAFIDSYLNRINDLSPADVDVSATFDPVTRQADVQVSATFATEVMGDFRFSAILVEDDVTGTSAEYNQNNYYSYEVSNTPLIGAGHDWQAEPNPVPASEMHYDFVGRDILGGFIGLAGSLPAVCSLNSTYSHAFTTIIPSDWDVTQMRVIGVLHDATTGHILNVNRSAYGITTAVAAVKAATFSLSIYPNPAGDFAQIEIKLEKAGEYTVEIFDVMGKKVMEHTYGGSYGKNILPLTTSTMQAGIYHVRVQVEGVALTRRLFVR
jgi:hypothetical protein